MRGPIIAPLSLITMVLPLGMGCGVDCPDPEVWPSEYQVYVYGEPPLEYLDMVGGSVLVWSVYHGGYNEEDRSYLDEVHEEGVMLASNYPTMQASLSVTGDIDLAERSACRDIDGEPAMAYWIVTEDVYLPCHNNPEWQEFLKGRVLEHIEGDADAIHIDEIEGIGGHLYTAGFCDYCDRGFTDFLMENFTPEELSGEFGIEDPDDFSYRDYIRGLGGRTPMSDPNVELRSQFVRFQIESRKEMLQEIVGLAKGWSCRQVLFTGNTFHLSPNKHPFMELLDFAVFENDMEIPPGKNVGTYLLGRALSEGRRMVMFPDILTLYDLMDEDPGIFRTFVEESFSLGESFLLPHQAYTISGETYTLPHEEVSDLMKFLGERAGMVMDGEMFAFAGVLYDFKVNIKEYREEGFIYPWLVGWDSHLSYLGACLILTEGHIPFDTIYSGDSLLVERSPDLDTLAGYPVLLLPGPSDAGEELEDLLNEYERWGGTVIRRGDLFLEYYQERGEEVREAVLEEVRDHLEYEIDTDAEADISLIPWAGENSLAIISVNYGRDDGGVVPSPSFHMGIDIPPEYEIGISEVIFETPEGEEGSLDFEFDGRRMEFDVPEFTEFCIIHTL